MDLQKEELIKQRRPTLSENTRRGNSHPAQKKHFDNIHFLHY